MNIFIMGQTTLHWGRMEFGNIGNYYIIEPFIRELHANFPESYIRTTLQMSERFCKEEKVEVVPLEIYYDFESNKNLEFAKKELRLVEEFLINKEFSDTTQYIQEVIDADFVIDFSGDIWGDNANFLGEDRFEVGLYKDMIPQKLGKPVFMIAGSPGPFHNVRLKELAKKVFANFTAVTNREPISSNLLKMEGFDVSHLYNLTCPAFLFEPKRGLAIEKLIKQENIIALNKPTVGFVICGWNFSEGPFDKWPRNDLDYEIFAKTVEYITNVLHARVCLLSHSNGFPIPPEKFELIHGRDYPIIKQLQKVIKNRGISNDVFALDGVYDAWTTKAIIAKFDMLVSGRVHAAVAGFSQCVPTVVIDYGHEPKAQKLRGFAKVVEQEKYVCNPAEEKNMMSKIRECWENRNLVKKELQEKIPEVKEQARENFRVIKKNIL